LEKQFGEKPIHESDSSCQRLLYGMCLEGRFWQDVPIDSQTQMSETAAQPTFISKISALTRQ
jgi:hypothetical protein